MLMSSSCCRTNDGTFTSSLTIALAGNPNSGKTTLFNALTGLRQHVGNYPGVTVERKSGRCALPGGQWADIIDLPGTYSLISRSPDERVAMQVLRGLREDTPAPDAVIVVVDASNLQRNLYLVSQLIELGRPLVVALNMMDVAERRGLRVSPDALERELGVPVVPLVAHRRQGIEELKAAILNARVAPMPNWPLPEAMKEELVLVGGGLAILDSREGETLPTPTTQLHTDLRHLDRYQALAERLLIGDHADDLTDISYREPVTTLLNSAARRMNLLGIDAMQADIEAHYRWIEKVSAAATSGLDGHTATTASAENGVGNRLGQDGSPLQETTPGPVPTHRTASERVDAFLMHRFWGFVVFAAIMASLFVAMFWLADPLIGGIESLVGMVGEWVGSSLPAGPIHDLVVDGVFAGVGSVIVFVPQIAILFLFLSVLEDSGYLARAAFLMDRLLAKVGLAGKSFIPLLSSFACAIPAVLATRTIENRKDRLATILVAPFMSCSARLPVYTLLIGGMFASYGAAARAGMMLSLYTLGIVAAATTAWCFRRSLLRGPAPAFIMELPSYKVPQLSQVARQMWVNTGEFLKRAGTIIFVLSVIVWAITYYGASPSKLAALEASGAGENAVAAYRLDHSIAGRFGHAVEPLIAPLGYDWKMGVGLVGAFAAREVFVSTMGIIYSVGDSDDDLAAAMRADRYADGTPVWTMPVALSLLVWFVLSMQCLSTLAVVRRETGSWKWPLFMLAYMNGLAYIICLAVYQAGRLLA